MMLAERHHGTRLRSLGALSLLRNKAHLSADLELVEAAICDAVAVKIDFARVGGDEAAIAVGQQARDPAVIGNRVRLRLAAAPPHMVFQEAARRVKGVADRNIRILVRVVRAGLAPDDDLASGNRQVDPDLEQIALLVPPMGALDDNPAGGDPVEELIEFFGPLADARLQRGRGVHVAERDLQRQTHKRSSCPRWLTLRTAYGWDRSSASRGADTPVNTGAPERPPAMSINPNQ